MSETTSIEDYARQRPQYFSRDVAPLLARVLPSLPRGTILDCGCGDGDFLFALRERGLLDGRDVRAIDLSEERVAIARSLDSRIAARTDSAESLDTVPDASVDFFHSSQVIEHVDDAKMARAIARVTKPGARIYVSTVKKKRFAWYYLKNANGERVLDPTHLREYRSDEELLGKFDPRAFRLLANESTPVAYPLLDFVAHRLKFADRTVLALPIVERLRRIRVPVPRYFTWELLFERVA